MRFEQAEAIHAELRAVVPPQVLDMLVLAWRHDHFLYQSPSRQKRYHQREREEWLDLAEGLLDDEFEPLKALVFDLSDARQAGSIPLYAPPRWSRWSIRYFAPISRAAKDRSPRRP